ncbi:alpha-glucuronidase family glycosyl hydrolase [Cohnella thailandensis]|uniref:Xylan alpha-1,2-glucuronidase n=1 Tax=Cohnella thailandensis TaxID=557557 RepID=A0A841T1H1_9BACL|nr:alpha-glucuronidase [Cohnella thailandensis]MBP1977814.1 alpha-glucuronidase [Cohnella thailandensis]
MANDNQSNGGTFRRGGEPAGEAYKAWLRYARLDREFIEGNGYASWCGTVVTASAEDAALLATARRELAEGIESMLGRRPQESGNADEGSFLLIGTLGSAELQGLTDAAEREAIGDEGYILRAFEQPMRRFIAIGGNTDKGVLYGAFHLLRLLQTGQPIRDLNVVDRPASKLRMIDHWDNMDGSVERGYAGRSIFFREGDFLGDWDRVRDYARLMAAVGLNAVAINNVNVHETETRLIAPELLPSVARAASVFREYGIRLYLSVNFASPIQLGGLTTADPLDPRVREWWAERTADVYRHVPDFGGYLVKADSEFRPGPFTYGRDHADGANLLAEALRPHGGIVIWRCFVYDCQQDWRDRKTDRARAAYDHFRPLDGKFDENVILQIKNGPMDFQVREPVSPLFGGLQRTNQVLELQITQEYTGQQRHLCYLVPQWKEAIDFDTYAKGPGSTVAKAATGELFDRPLGGFAAVSNIGDDGNWTGHPLAQANFYGFGRLAWRPELSAEQIADEWVRLTFGSDPDVVATIGRMLLDSWPIYEKYTSPLGVGWMVNPNHHYGPNVDGYEYSMWGTYHYADCHGIGVDRTVRTGTGYAGQYHDAPAAMYESAESCPDELLLFFHHLPYSHVLKSGRTIIQHIYDTHFEGAEQAEGLVETWRRLSGKIDAERYESVLSRLEQQAKHAAEWRDVVNTYFCRKSGIPDAHGRQIY